MRHMVFRDYLISAATVLFFMLMIGLTIFSVRSKTKQFSGDAMASDLVILAQAFDRINKDCTILSFDHQKNPINFLNVASFSGSQVGPINVAHPERWQGPYLEDNPSIQGKEYQIVRTKAGFFIVPGEGVELPNGKIVGKDIIFDEHADIARMIHEKALSFNDKPLAIELHIVPAQPASVELEQIMDDEF